MLASVPLFTCTIVFFAKFGEFLCLTIAFSWLFANFVFMSLLTTFGDTPQAFAKLWLQKPPLEMGKQQQLVGV